MFTVAVNHTRFLPIRKIDTWAIGGPGMENLRTHRFSTGNFTHGKHVEIGTHRFPICLFLIKG